MNWTWGNSPIAGGGTGNPAEGEGTLWAVADIPDTCCAVNGPPKVGQINVYYSTLSRMLTIDLNDRGDEILTYGNRLCDPTAEEELRKEFNVMFSMNVNNCNIAPGFPKVTLGLNVDAPTKPDDCSHFRFAVICQISCSSPPDPCGCAAGKCSMPAGSGKLSYTPKQATDPGTPNETGSVAWSTNFDDKNKCETTPCSTQVTITEIGRGTKPRTSV